ncbi:hypothetical protein WHR41_06263 [Cladosporium halotolerans]|uniref:Aspartate/glutamate racemase family protein n=1 Tax=Cladosporium halotolerans TaxID=1052096 RepID=A0AB34KH62_9PEZI
MSDVLSKKADAAKPQSSNQVDPSLPPLGFIAIECFFTRPPGDPFTNETWNFPLIRELAVGTAESQVVTSSDYDDAFLDRFVDAGKTLADKGCVGLITSCGFLALAQSRLAARLPIPIATSALVQIPSIMAIMAPSQTLGILTYDSQRLQLAHVESAGVHPALLDRVHIAGAPTGGHLHRLVQQNAGYDHKAIEAELVTTAQQLIQQWPTMSVLVLECTQMPPFAEAIQRSMGRSVQVYDVYSMVNWFYGGLVKRVPSSWRS